VIKPEILAELRALEAEHEASGDPYVLEYQCECGFVASARTATALAASVVEHEAYRLRAEAV
jgi:hypothetical protein